jgi:hypothetical protein
MNDVLPPANRRLFLRSSLGLGGLALGELARADAGGVLAQPHHPPKVTRVISLFMAGGPSQLDLFDPKPELSRRQGQDLPDSVRAGQRLTGMSAFQAALPLAGSAFRFTRHGQSGATVSELLPHTAGIADELCFVKSVVTEAINHDPAITFFQTGHQLAGRPSIGAWLSYGLGSLNTNLPSFVVLVSKDRTEQGLYARLWGSGFLPSRHQGVQFRGGRDPVLYLTNPPGVSAADRRAQLDALAELHALQAEATGDPEALARVDQYEMAYRMQTSVPEVMDLSRESAEVLASYGPDAGKPGTFAANCVLARRLAERGVRFVQLYHPGWDQHGNLPKGIRRQAKDVDQACAALVRDLKRTGLWADTLVVWGGEFGRTCYSQGKLTAADYGRDHHPRCFTIWLAGGGVRPGFTLGATDEFGYNVADRPVHVHDVQATLLHLLGIDHERLTYKAQGRYYRLTDVHGTVVRDILT